MFSSFISFRDITLYVIPGNITVYLFLKILGLYNITPFPYLVNATASNIGLLFIFASFSTCIGFLQSQIFIQIFNWEIEKNKKNPFVLVNLDFDDRVKSNITRKAASKFDLESNFVFNTTHFQLCNNYVLARTNEHSYGYSRRLISFSLFATVIPLPFTLSLSYFLCKLNSSIFLLVTVILISFCLSIYFCYNMTYDFRKKWVKNVFAMFLALPEDK